AGLIAPDEVTWQYLAGRPLAPKGADFDRMVEDGRRWVSDEGASFDRSLVIDGAALEPMITWGTNPGMGMAISGRVPDPEAMSGADRAMAEKSLAYMDLRPGAPIVGTPVDVVFVGSCTNSRLSDLQAAASVLNGRKVRDGVRMLVVPGSVEIKREAEALGLDRVFLDAGAQWRDAGCSMCIAMNGDLVEPGQLCVSTSNRNFEGRQGPGSRTLLASPLTAAASAVMGAVTDPRTLMEAP
ncbi:MAG TPA: aconitase family protein, partial [Myxococcota bacterium]|nr:aconitase family protein [Myxococcota bacterium]